MSAAAKTISELATPPLQYAATWCEPMALCSSIQRRTAAGRSRAPSLSRSSLAGADAAPGTCPERGSSAKPAYSAGGRPSSSVPRGPTSASSSAEMARTGQGAPRWAPSERAFASSCASSVGACESPIGPPAAIHPSRPPRSRHTSLNPAHDSVNQARVADAVSRGFRVNRTNGERSRPSSQENTRRRRVRASGRGKCPSPG